MFIRTSLPKSGWVKFDKKVFTLPISAGAKVLYGYLVSSSTGTAYKDQHLLNVLKVSQKTLYKQKKELKDEELLLIEQIIPRVYVAYIGYTGKTAEQVKREWDKEDGLPKPKRES